MIDALIPVIIGVFSALGGILIKDIKALGIFTALVATSAFIIAYVTNMPTISLGLLGLITSAVRIGRAGKRVVERRIRTYRAGRRLKSLEEAARSIPENIVDIIPAGSTRMIHPKIVELVTLVNNAAVKGYAVEEPPWFKAVEQYMAIIGPQVSATKTKVVSEYEVVDLEE
ncbi:MAG: hypothetical protein QXJ71_09770 [Pyrobaculum sp.]